MFRIGQKVVRIGGNQKPGYCGPKIGEGGTVVNVFTIDDGTEHIELAEFPSPETDEHYAGYKARFFRPVVGKKTDISVFEEILRRETVDDRVADYIAYEQRVARIFGRNLRCDND